MNQEKIGKFIAEKRKKLNLTQAELAEKLGITDKSISNWENGKNMPDISLIKPLCEVLNITPDELLEGKITNDKKRIHKRLDKKNIIILFGLIFLLIIITSIILLTKKESNDEKLTRLLSKIDETEEVLITDTYKEDGEVTFTIQDKEKIKRILEILKKVQISKAGFSETYRYRIKLLDKDDILLLELKYWPLKIQGIDVFLEEMTDDNLYRVLNKYTITLRESVKSISDKLKSVKRLVIRNYDTGKLIKEIKDENRIFQFTNLILESKIWEGAINLPSQQYDIGLYDKENYLIGNVVFNPYLSIHFNNKNYQLGSFDKETLLKIINE